MPAISNPGRNFFCEFVGTWLLVLCILMFSAPGNSADIGLGTVGAFPVTMLIMRDSGWSYSWIPVLGPIAGAAFAALTFALIF